MARSSVKPLERCIVSSWRQRRAVRPVSSLSSRCAAVRGSSVERRTALRQLPRIQPERIAVLAHEVDVSLAIHRDDRDRLILEADLAVLAPGGRPDSARRGARPGSTDYCKPFVLKGFSKDCERSSARLLHGSRVVIIQRQVTFRSAWAWHHTRRLGEALSVRRDDVCRFGICRSWARPLIGAVLTYPLARRSTPIRAKSERRELNARP